MNTATRRSATPNDKQSYESLSPERAPRFLPPGFGTNSATTSPLAGRARVLISGGSRLLRQALARILSQRREIDVVGLDAGEPSQLAVNEARAQVLLLASCGGINEDVPKIREARLKAPSVPVLLLGMTRQESDFLQYVRAGVSGYLPLDVPADELVRGIEAVLAGEAVCPGSLCAGLFRFHEREAKAHATTMIRQVLGLTRREQQIVPLIAQGLTNKEIRVSCQGTCVARHLRRQHARAIPGFR
jgi:DNA-binding NarL/FixJ family response regulator